MNVTEPTGQRTQSEEAVVAFLGLEQGSPPGCWALPVTPGVATVAGALFGGCGFAAAIEALERTAQRPLAWASVHYYTPVFAPHVVEVAPEVVRSGRQVTHARAQLTLGEDLLAVVNAALGEGAAPATGPWVSMPDVPSPDSCVPCGLRLGPHRTLLHRLDTRLAAGRDLGELDGTPGSGSCALWARLEGTVSGSASSLALLADYWMFVIGQAVGDVLMGGYSISNALHVADTSPSDWVLIDMSLDTLARGFGHGTARLWSDDGRLLATADQTSVALRMPDDWRDPTLDEWAARRRARGLNRTSVSGRSMP